MTSNTYSAREEWLNCAVHVVGIVASLVALPVLVTTALRTGEPWLLVGGLTFGLSALLMFSTSSLYHAS
ncbi:MAG: hemolysin III family protein, partial [Steroidobacteraceae bacterium]|nr:hemolysin III family protein [Steroidobacteraceae bacterium]